LKRIYPVIKLIERQVREFNIPWVTEVSKEKDPYKILISCILSLRTKDSVTSKATETLFKIADTPKKMIEIPLKTLERLIYPVGFYRNKAKVILGVSKKILEEFGGKTPSKLEDLLKLKGVGQKTANLVLGLGYRIPSICVDTHVHRISNRIGWANTDDPQKTEMQLKRVIPKRYWIRLNSILVAFGQNVCLPISPWCSRCWINRYCKKRGVKKFR
jgi:endonuclease-3